MPTDLETAERQWRTSMGKLRRLTDQYTHLEQRETKKLYELLQAIVDADTAFAAYLEIKHREEP